MRKLLLSTLLFSFLFLSTTVLCSQAADVGQTIPGVEELQKAISDAEKLNQQIKEKISSAIDEVTRTITQQVTADDEITSTTPDAKTITRANPLVYVIPIEGMVQEIMMTIFKRGLREAKDEGAELVLLEMDTPGGALTVAEEISRTLLESKVPTATWIKNEGLSAGMLIAISTNKIFMRDLAVLGDCQPIMLAPGEMQEAPEKVLTVVRQYGERAARRNGYPVDAVLAMIDKDLNYQSADGSIKAATGKILTLGANQAVSIGMASGVAETREEVLKQLKLENAEVRTLNKNWAEDIASWIALPTISSLLTLIGLAALFIEYKTPGFGVFGATGLVLLGLVFWGHAIAHLAGYEGALLFLVGMVLLGVEIFVFPGFGIFGALALGLIIVGLVMTVVRVPIFDNPLFFPSLHLSEPLFQVLVSTVGSIVLIFIALKYLPRLGTIERVGMSLATSLDADKGYTSHDDRDEQKLVGMIGTAVSPLRPSGIITLGGKRMNVVTDGDFVEPGSSVQVILVEGSRMVVRPVETKEEA